MFQKLNWECIWLIDWLKVMRIIIIFEYVITKSIRIEDKRRYKKEERKKEGKEDLKISFFFLEWFKIKIDDTHTHYTLTHSNKNKSVGEGNLRGACTTIQYNTMIMIIAGPKFGYW